MAGRGISDGVDTVLVHHISGETSELTFKSYDQGRQRWQAATLDLVWLDEEPDEEIYTEALSRTNATEGMVYITFTPLLGMSSVVYRIALFRNGDETPCAVGRFVHVYVDRITRRPVPIPPAIRSVVDGLKTV